MEQMQNKQWPKIKYTEYEGDNAAAFQTDSYAVKTMKGFAKLSKLYSCVVDPNGKLIGTPVGPATNLGAFYDLFETPIYKQYYMRIKEVVLERCSPKLFVPNEGPVGAFSVAPIAIKDKLLGFWVLASYTEEETKQLKLVLDDHWDVAYAVSDVIYKNRVIEAEMEKARSAGQRLEDELIRTGIVNKAWNRLNQGHGRNIDEVLTKLLAEVGQYLGLPQVYLYAKPNYGARDYDLRVHWVADETRLQSGGIQENTEQHDVVSTHILEDMFMLEQSPAVQTYPILINDTLYGKLYYVADDTKIWAQKDLAFARTISVLVQSMIEFAEGDDILRRVNNHLIETYNNFNVGIFIRDAVSGEVLFSNAAMNEMLGQDFTGGDSREILTDLRDRFDNIGGMRKPFITKERVVSWRSYIQRFDSIMDITEIQMEWLKGEQASLIILRKANDL